MALCCLWLVSAQQSRIDTPGLQAEEDRLDTLALDAKINGTDRKYDLLDTERGEVRKIKPAFEQIVLERPLPP